MENSLKPKDIVFLMKACKLYDVDTLEFCGLKLSRNKNQESLPPSPRATKEADNIAAEEFKKEILESKRDVVDHLLIEDPLQYEKLLTSGELEDLDEETHD